MGTVSQLAQKVNGNGPDKFLLDQPQYGLTPDTKLIVFEDEYNQTPCDSDYNDLYWVVTVTPASPAPQPLAPCSLALAEAPRARAAREATRMCRRTKAPITPATFHWARYSPRRSRPSWLLLQIYNSIAGDPDWGYGYGWSNPSLPAAYPTANGVSVAFDSSDAAWFSGSDSTGYSAQFGSTERLVHSGTQYLMTDPDGTVYTFNDFSQSTPGTGERGVAGRGENVANYNSDGSVTSLDYFPAGKRRGEPGDRFHLSL